MKRIVFCHFDWMPDKVISSHTQQKRPQSQSREPKVSKQAVFSITENIIRKRHQQSVEEETKEEECYIPCIVTQDTRITKGIYRND